MTKQFGVKALLSVALAINVNVTFAFVPQPVPYKHSKNPVAKRCKHAVVVSMGVDNTNAVREDEECVTATDENPRLFGLALMLDEGTRKSHSMAENTAFVSGFFKGLGTREAYRTLITSLYFVYKAMEEAFEKTSEETVRTMDDEELRRLSALEQDMDYFYSREWRDVIEPSPATQAYVSRIKEVAETRPSLLVAHQYTRYLGDLFGGRMMGGMATRSLDLKDGNGVAFYTFDDIPSANDFITVWYSKLNQLRFTEEEKQDIVDEANLVFDLNISILEELEGSPFKAMWTLALNTIKQRLGLNAR